MWRLEEVKREERKREAVRNAEMRRVEEKREERRTMSYLKDSDGDGIKGEGRGKEIERGERERAIG